MPKFIHPHATAGTRDYTSRPLREVHDDTPEMRERIAAACSLRDEPEAISGHWVDANSELSEMWDRQRRLADHAEAKIVRASLPVLKRLEDAKRRAKAKRLNFDHELHIISKMLSRGNQRGVERLERLEALLDGVLETAA